MGSFLNTDAAAGHFQLLARDGGARRGRLHTLHGVVETPVFMPVGTRGAVKALTPAQVADTGAQIILGNTYHLNLRPGAQVVSRLGGLHKFMGWERPILTDSGGFQVFSLAKLRRMDDAGVTFQSHIDGAEVRLGPRECLDIQRALGSDIAMVLDECPPWPCAEAECAAAVRRTLRWAREFLGFAYETGFLAAGHLVFGIAQGSVHEALRRECAQALAAMDFPGYAIGGVSVGEPEPEMLAQVAVTIPHLPVFKPRYVMGVGTPPQLLKMIALGADMFDCVMPTRLARHGTAFTPDGVINLRNERHKLDERPLVEGADNYCCRHFSRAYLRHLCMSGEMSGATLLAIHNIHFFQDLMARARERIETGSFAAWAAEWIARYEAGNKENNTPDTARAED
jgi:queuine tRNA-ribosyltransferase